jgi:dCMP deaminase
MNPTERKRPDWDQYGLLLAYAAAQRSPDPYLQVGAVAFKADHSTAGSGYNGAPSGIEIDWSDREKRRPFVDHAEYNCLKYTKKGEPHYLYVTLSPCSSCLKLASSYGVKEIIYDKIYDRDQEALSSASKFGIKITQLDSLYAYLFKTYTV